jgi:hypothetical protein
MPTAWKSSLGSSNVYEKIPLVSPNFRLTGCQFLFNSLARAFVEGSPNKYPKWTVVEHPFLLSKIVPIAESAMSNTKLAFNTFVQRVYYTSHPFLREHKPATNKSNSVARDQAVSFLT